MQKTDTSQNIGLEIIKKSIENQNTALMDSNLKIDKSVQLMQNDNVDKFYKTVIDIPKLLNRQLTEKFRYRKHSLISSQDRDLSNEEFDKYNFKVVFGDTAQSLTRNRWQRNYG